MSVSSPCDDKDYKCTLSPECVKKAKKELGEQADTCLLEVKQLRNRLQNVSGLQPRTDINFLLAFLRARKFNQEKTFQLISNHYKEKKDNPSQYDDLKPSSVKHVIEDNMFEVLRHRDNEGCRVIIVRASRWDPDRYPPEDTIKLLFLMMSKLSEEEETQVCGIHVIDLLTGVGWKQAKNITPQTSKLIASTLQNMCPLRLRRYDFVDEPSFFHLVFPIFKQFLKEKLVKRMHINNDNMDSLFSSIGPERLPNDIKGGQLEPFEYNKEWMPKLLESDHQFEYSNKFGYLSMGVDTAKHDSKDEDAGLKGMGGTFKKLEM